MASDAVINAIYEELLHHPADALALSTFSGQSAANIASAVLNSAEFDQALIDDVYWAYLHRQADSLAQPLVQALASGATIETIKADVLGSQEYFIHAGGTNTAFIQQLYRDVLHREADSAGLSIFLTELGGGASRAQVASQVLTSTEGYTNLIDGYYQTFTGRTPSSTELSTGLSFFTSGGTDQAFIANLLGSAEFGGKADAGTATYTDSGVTIGSFNVGHGFSLVLGASAVEGGEVTLSGGTVDVQSGAVVDGPIFFSGTGGLLEIDGSRLPADPTKLLNGAVVSGFGTGDTIDLTGVVLDRAGHVDLTAGNLLKITEGGHVYDLQLDPTQNFAGDFFHLASDGLHGTDITENSVACYCRGTLILTEAGERPVEMLKIGDRVTTKTGCAKRIKWIGRRSYGGRFMMGRKDILPICITADALGDNVPKRDLWISPHHAMYFGQTHGGGVLIEARDLVNEVSIFQPGHVDEVEYFHVELETHDVIIAEGALSETFIDDGSRGMFHNAHDYALLYPDHAPRPVRYCAPRLEIGYEVEAVRRRLARHAGLRAISRAAGSLRGHVDVVSPRAIEGWAQIVDHPEAPVCFEIYADSRLIGQTLANRYREDLREAGIGSGRHAFVFTPPDGVVISRNSVEVRRSLDGAALPSANAADEAA
jgi:hypothetical protein